MVMIHTVCITIGHACVSDGGTVLALPLLIEYMTQALYCHMSRVVMELSLLFITLEVPTSNCPTTCPVAVSKEVHL